MLRLPERACDATRDSRVGPHVYRLPARGKWLVEPGSIPAVPHFLHPGMRLPCEVDRARLAAWPYSIGGTRVLSIEQQIQFNGAAIQADLVGREIKSSVGEESHPDHRCPRIDHFDLPGVLNRKPDRRSRFEDLGAPQAPKAASIVW